VLTIMNSEPGIPLSPEEYPPWTITCPQRSFILSVGI
jgi:hypothetical protein